jgi:C1q domain
MRQRLRSHLTFANVISMIALFVALGGVGAYATHETILSSDIVDGEVKTPDLGTTAVTNAKIANGAVTNLKLGINAVSTGKVIDNNLQGIDIKDATLTGTDVMDATLTGTDITDNTLGTADIGSGAITNSDLADGIVSTNKLAFGAVDSVRILDNTVQSFDVKNDDLTAADLGAGAVGQSELAAGAVSPAAFGTIPAARVQKTANQAVPHSTDATITFDSELFDTAGLHDNVTNNGRLTAPISGIYQVSAGITWAANSTGRRDLAIFKNFFEVLVAGSSTSPNPSPSITTHSASGLVNLAAGDHVFIDAIQTSGGSLSATNGGSFLAMTWVGPG